LFDFVQGIKNYDMASITVPKATDDFIINNEIMHRFWDSVHVFDTISFVAHLFSKQFLHATHPT
jgi:hypothetical protein